MQDPSMFQPMKTHFPIARTLSAPPTPNALLLLLSQRRQCLLRRCRPLQMLLLRTDQDRRMLDIRGSFSSLLASNGQFRSLLKSLSPIGSVCGVPLSAFSETPNSNSDLG
ncbi:hypothetical protein PVL29_003473 [Vitis rotundifolia]|uniref:Uncharacterized protein n=1 Tax=Vitis rotundifolia TaxID=103349 RepID=A0AA39ADD9_VITRO|nr:hypothetical protein PVL29_003473 [Vitis rotundifolia]